MKGRIEVIRVRMDRKHFDVTIGDAVARELRRLDEPGAGDWELLAEIPTMLHAFGGSSVRNEVVEVDLIIRGAK